MHLEVDKVGIGIIRGRMSQVGGRKVLTGGREILTGGRRIQREAQKKLRRSSGHGRSARQAMMKRPQAIRLSQVMIDLAVVRGVVSRTGVHVRREMRCTFFGKP